MMKFTINAKELKTMIEKGMTAINKKATLSFMKRLYFTTENDGIIKVLGTDTEHFVEIKSINAWDVVSGTFGIDIDDIKVLLKMNGNITLEDDGQKINVKCGKKIVTISKYENEDILLPVMETEEQILTVKESQILTVKESWLLDTLVNLYPFTSNDDYGKILQAFNFNTKDKRIEAIDSYVIGMRTLEKQEIVKDESIMMHRKCVQVFKKIMDKKSNANIKIYQDKKYIKVEGNDFTYIIRRIEGEYYNINKMLTSDNDYNFIANKENILSVMKFNCDLLNKEKKPVIFHSENGKLYSYMKTSKYETFDELETKDIQMSNDLYIGFNPNYLVNALSIIDNDNPICRGKNDKSPMYIEGNEYQFMILPIRIEYEKHFNHIKELINRGNVA